MKRRTAAVCLVAALTLVASAAASTGPANGTQALKIVQGIIAQAQVPCALTWKRMTAQPLTTDGHSWRVTVTGVVTNKVSGNAIWMLTATTKPANALATAISNGCR